MAGASADSVRVRYGAWIDALRKPRAVIRVMLKNTMQVVFQRGWKSDDFIYRYLLPVELYAS